MELIPRREGLRRPSMRQVVVVMPSAFTLGNLFFGFWAIVSAFNGNFRWAGWFIVFAGILDMFFVISGFLITTLLLQEHAENGEISLRKFYSRRAIRLLHDSDRGTAT